MTVLILGLLVLLGVHSLRIFADDWRGQRLVRLGEMRWKGIHALVSLIGFALICWGFGLARQHPVLLYVPPLAPRHLNALFTLLAFVLVAAAYVPRNHLKQSSAIRCCWAPCCGRSAICSPPACCATWCCSARS